MIIYKVEKKPKKKRGRGLLNKIINKLPFELHLPGYRFCGPGTKLEKRLARGDQPKNQLDSACREHDIAYFQNKENINARNAADKVLAHKAWERVVAKNSSFGEKAAAYGVTNIMKLKSKLGMGFIKNMLENKESKKKKAMKRKVKKKSCKKRINLKNIIQKTSKSIAPGKTPKSIINATLKTTKKLIKEAGGKSKINIPRILPIPAKVGGFLPLIPLLAGLSATGTLAGGAAGVYKALNEVKSFKQQLDENKRHNKTMEAIALGKGLHLKPYKTGLGLHLKPYKGKGLKKKSLK